MDFSDVKDLISSIFYDESPKGKREFNYLADSMMRSLKENDSIPDTRKNDVKVSKEYFLKNLQGIYPDLSFDDFETFTNIIYNEAEENQTKLNRTKANQTKLNLIDIYYLMNEETHPLNEEMMISFIEKAYELQEKYGVDNKPHELTPDDLNGFKENKKQSLEGV